MTQEEIFSVALGIQKPWYVESIELDIAAGELNVNVNFERGSSFFYKDEEPNKEGGYYKAYDTHLKTWRHMNFFQYRCMLNAWVPRVDLGNGKVRQVKTPWEGLSSGFTLLFEALILQLAAVMTVHQISKMVGTYDKKIWKLLSDYTEKCRKLSDYSQVKQVGMDETAVLRGHHYVTQFVDLETKNTLYVTEGKGSETVKEFVDDLEKHGGKAENIEHVSCDMSPAFIKGVNQQLPKAKITFDKFHIIKILNEAVDKVRREEQKTNPILKKSRYIFLKNRENYTSKQKAQFEELRMSKLNIITFKALHIREAFQQIYQESRDRNSFEILLKKWYSWATRCRISPVKEAAKTIKNHWEGIVNHSISKINNGVLEGFNSIFQAAKAKARGYKDLESIRTIIYILTGKLNFSVVNPFCTTHSLL